MTQLSVGLVRYPQIARQAEMDAAGSTEDKAVETALARRGVPTPIRRAIHKRRISAGRDIAPHMEAAAASSSSSAQGASGRKGAARTVPVKVVVDNTSAAEEEAPPMRMPRALPTPVRKAIKKRRKSSGGSTAPA